jgi:hypothetical protein
LCSNEFEKRAMPTLSERESILVVGASGRTGAFVTRYLCAASVPVIACVRRADRLPAEPLLSRAEVSLANLDRPDTVASLMDRAAHVIWVAGSERRSLSPGAWQLEVESLSACLELGRRSGFDGRFIYVSHSGAVLGESATWAESRWRELKVEAEQAIVSSGVNYFVLRTGRVSAPVHSEPRVSVSQQASAILDAELPCNALGFLLTGAVLAGATDRSKVTVRLDSNGAKLQAAVQAFARLRTDAAESTAGAMGVSLRRA